MKYIVSVSTLSEEQRTQDEASELAQVYAMLTPQFETVAAAKAAEAPGWEGKIRYLEVTINEVEG